MASSLSYLTLNDKGKSKPYITRFSD